MIRFKHFRNLDKRSSDLDLASEILTECQNLSTSDRLGMLIKDAKYGDVSSTLVASLPSGYTLQNIVQWTVGLPTKKDIYLIHAKKSGLDRILMGPNFNVDISQNTGAPNGTFGSVWVDLLEFEGDYTAETGTTAGIIKSSSLLASVDDYYLGWYVRVKNLISSGKHVDAVVVKYVELNKSLMFVLDAFTGIVVGQTFRLSRSPFLLDGVLKEMPEVEDFIRFLKREKEVVFMSGNNKQYPTQFNGWLGFISSKMKDNTPGNEDFFENYQIDMQQMVKPYSGTPPAGVASPWTITPQSGGSLDVGNWDFKFAFEYDHFQIGPLSDSIVGQTTSVNKTLRILAKLPLFGSYDGANFIRVWDTNDRPSSYSQLLSHRVTALYIFAKGPNDTTHRLLNTAQFDSPGDNPQKIRDDSSSNVDYSLTGNKNFFLVGILTTETGGYFQSGTVGSDLVINPTGPTYEDLAGGTNLRTNFKYAVGIDRHIITGKIHNMDSNKQDNDLISSVVANAIPQPDIFIAKNISNLGYFGSNEITGLMVVGDSDITQSPKSRVFAFSEDSFFILDVTQGASYLTNLDRAGIAEGVIAPDSLVFAEGKIFGVSRNGFRVYGTKGSTPIGEGLKPDFDALTTPSDCKSTFYKNRRIVIFYFKTDNKSYYVDLSFSHLPMFEYSFADSFNWLARRRQGDILSVSDSKIFQHGTTDLQGTGFIVPKCSTINVDATRFGGNADDIIHLTSGLIRYRSDTSITVNHYLDRSSSPLSMPNVSFSSQSTLNDVRYMFPVGTTCKEVKMEILLDSTQKTTNTIFEIEDFGIDGFVTSNITT